MPRSYTMRGVLGVAAEATALAKSYLEFSHPGSRVHDVQDDPRFQHRGVDLLWERDGDAGKIVGVEVKGDRQDRRGNYFFEVVSNLQKDTPGCFLYSTADFYAYGFVVTRELHLLPLAETRAWFLSCSKDFPLKRTRTRMGQEWYTTVGAAVPIKRVQLEVPGAKRFRLTAETGWEPLAPPRRVRARTATSAA